MPSFNLPTDSTVSATIKGKALKLTKSSAIETFNPGVLGLGNIQSESSTRSAVAVIFDLQGFTSFCGQIEPSLTVPLFLNEFLNWLFAGIRKESINRVHSDKVLLWHGLPFFAKFMGDGILVLWDTAKMSQRNQHNLISSCLAILRQYEEHFHPKIRRKVSYAPPKLRCGIAKGTVLSVGNGEDYVGSCINLAARLQKMPGVCIAFSRKGFNPEDEWKGMANLKLWVLVKTAIRGIGDAELIYIPSKSYEKLSPEEKRTYELP